RIGGAADHPLALERRELAGAQAKQATEDAGVVRAERRRRFPDPGRRRAHLEWAPLDRPPPDARRGRMVDDLVEAALAQLGVEQGARGRLTAPRRDAGGLEPLHHGARVAPARPPGDQPVELLLAAVAARHALEARVAAPLRVARDLAEPSPLLLVSDGDRD